MALKRVEENSRIAISFVLSLLDGVLVDKTDEGELFEFQIGDGQLLNKIDELLIGLEEGTKAKFTLPPAEAFGERSSENLQSMPKSQFGDELRTGVVMAFNTPTGDEIPGEIVEINQDSVTVDFNHPLAGQTLVFEATIESVLE